MQAKSIQETGCEALTNIFAEIGKGYGYEHVEARFAPFRDVKVTWMRSYRNAEFSVTDYLKDAPEGVLRSLAETLFTKIVGIEDRQYSDEFCRYVTDPKFVDDNQYTYLKRSRNISMTPSGEHVNLNDSYERLIDAGYVDRDDQIALTWMRNEGTGSAGYCSAMMHVIVISKMFDREDVPENVVDFVLLNQLMKMEEGMVNFCRKRSNAADRIRTAVERFPDAEDVRKWMEGCCIHL